MTRKPLVAWAIVSFAAILIGFIWKEYDHGNHVALELFFFGWISSLLVVGYFSTPSNSLYGKIAFGFVIVMVAGIIMKILHYLGGNEIIITSLVGIAITYSSMWLAERRKR